MSVLSNIASMTPSSASAATTQVAAASGGGEAPAAAPAASGEGAAQAAGAADAVQPKPPNAKGALIGGFFRGASTGSSLLWFGKTLLPKLGLWGKLGSIVHGILPFVPATGPWGVLVAGAIVGGGIGLVFAMKKLRAAAAEYVKAQEAAQAAGAQPTVIGPDGKPMAIDPATAAQMAAAQDPAAAAAAQAAAAGSPPPGATGIPPAATGADPASAAAPGPVGAANAPSNPTMGPGLPPQGKTGKGKGKSAGKTKDPEQAVATLFLQAKGARKKADKKTYERGAHNDRIEYTQRVLKKLGYFDGPITGTLGPQTEEAIKRFQKENGLKASGSSSADLRRRLFTERVEQARATGT